MFEAGVKDYRERYWTPDYEPRDTDILTITRTWTFAKGDELTSTSAQ